MKARTRPLLHVIPFQAFVIRRADGKEYKIEHPDFVLAAASEVPQVILEEPDGYVHFLSILLMISVETIPAHG